MTLAILFTFFLVIGLSVWDAMELQFDHPTEAGWGVGAVSAALCALLLVRSRHRLPLLLCAAALISIRLASPFVASISAHDFCFTADCFAVCGSLSAIAFRDQIAIASRRARAFFRESHADARRSSGLHAVTPVEVTGD
jgi:hypothetical protein